MERQRELFKKYKRCDIDMKHPNDILAKYKNDPNKAIGTINDGMQYWYQYIIHAPPSEVKNNILPIMPGPFTGFLCKHFGELPYIRCMV